MADNRHLNLLGLHARDTDPSSVTEGDLWYRSDLDQVHAADSVGTVPLGPRATHPFISSAGWHNLPTHGGATTLALTLDLAYALPIVPGRACTLTAMAVNVTVLGLGNVRGAVYAADQNSGLPGSLVSDLGTISTGLTGVKTWGSLSIGLRPILYYLCVVQQGVVATLSARTGWDPIISETSATFGSDRNAYTQTGVSGAWPASFGTPSGTAMGPSVMAQLT